MNYVSAQNAAPYAFVNNMVQPAPNAAALGKYADYPVSFYTGVPEIGVPLYNLKDGAINLPISLSYHASGIRVSEVATWVGLGWALNAGGMITRTVRGAPDEGTRKSAQGAGPQGYYRDYGLSTFPVLPYPVNNQTSDPNNTFAGQTTFSLNACSLDCEPDLYTFNFNGHVGKFVFDEKQNARLLEDDNLKIKVNFLNGFTSWKITTSDGVQYIFGENNTYEVTNPVSSAGTIDPDSQAPSSWYLTRIINPNTKDTVRLSYTQEVYGYKDLGGETKVTVQPTNNSTACDNGGISVNLITTSINGWRLTAITSKNYTVKFIANTTRLDLTAGTYYGSQSMSAYSLDSIKVYNHTSQCIRQIVLNHGYFTSNTNTTAAVANLLAINYGSDATDSKRLKLLSVQEFSGDGSIQKPPSVFLYNETLQLPRRLSYDQDDWGFSNNFNGNYNYFFSPNVYDGLCIAGGGTGGGAVRTSRWPDMAAFTLTGIQDPLGVSSGFAYEANNANNTVVGGLRIQQISVTDNVTGTVKVKTYDYMNSGILFRTPVHLLRVDNEYHWNYGAAGYKGYTNNSFGVVAILKQSQSVVPLQDPQGNHIGYSFVKETLGASGEGGYTVYHFSTDQSPTLLNSKLAMSNYTAQGTMNNTSGVYGNGHFNDTTAYPAVLPQNLQYYYGYTNYYPFAPLQSDFYRGKLLSEQTYSSAGTMLASTDNTYATYLHENALIRGVKCFTTSTGSGSTAINWYALTYYKLHTGISHLVSTTKKTYSGSNYVAVSSNFGYESPYHTLKTSDTTTDSQGNILIGKTYYSLDYANTATTDNIFGKMKARNLLAPVSAGTWKNGYLVDQKITKFYDFAASSIDTLINPANIYALETATPLSPQQAGGSTIWRPGALLPNAYLIAKVNFSFDGNTGRMINQQLTNDKSQGILWSSQLKIPIALADNAVSTPALKEFYYEGFEESAVSGLYTGRGHTGTNSVFAPYTINWTLPNSRSYVISYWYLTNNVWSYQPEQPFTGSLALTGGSAYDDIRIHPADATMVTYTYDAAGNLTSSTDAKSLTTYYEYDSFQRLRNIKDKDGNILKNYCYNYQGQQTGCPVTQTYTNVAKSGMYTRNNCGSGYSGSLVTYTVPAGTYTSTASQSAADLLAQNDVTANGQNYANMYGTCTTTCTGNAYKMVNGVCEQGTEIYDTSTGSGTHYTCTYHYQWSDGSVSTEYTKSSTSACAI